MSWSESQTAFHLAETRLLWIRFGNRAGLMITHHLTSYLYVYRIVVRIQPRVAWNHTQC